MKRSLINEKIKWAREQLAQANIKLPMFGYFKPEDWSAYQADTVKAAMLGWDVTDFGCGDFHKVGAVLFTVRNGVVNHPEIGTPYAEKYIVLEPGQRLPIHMHVCKSEDIISRAGAPFEIKLYNTAKDGGVDYESDVTVYCDGIPRTVKAGEVFRIENGNSITLTPYMYHSFWGAPGEEAAVIGEVSSVNDDNTDNYFAEDVNRISTLEEDEEKIALLCNEYE